MHPFSKLRSLLTRKRWQSFLLEAGLIIAVILGAQCWQTRGLPVGAAPPLAGVLTNGQAIKVGADETAKGGIIRFRTAGYATTWGLKAQLWVAEAFPA